MSIPKYKTTSQPTSQNGWHTPKPLQIPQILTIFILIIFNTTVIEIIPIQIGPITPTILMEAIVLLAILPRLNISYGYLDSQDKYLLFVGVCMFVLSLINLSGHMGRTQFRYIFTSVYAYFLIVNFFSGRPEYGIWLRRLHLIPALATLYRIISQILFTSAIGLEAQIRANQSASYLVMLLPVCWVQFQHERGLFRFLNNVIIWSLPLIIVVTASRTAFLIYFFMIIMTILIEEYKKSKIILIMLLLILMMFLLFMPESSVFAERMYALRNPTEALGFGRFSLWKAALRFIKENPLRGGDFRANVRQLVLEVAPESNYARHILAGATNLQLGIHNGYLAVMAYFGLIVAFLYFRYFYSLGKALLNTRKKIHNHFNSRLLLAGFLCVLGYAIANISHHFYIGQNFFIIWAVLQSSLKNVVIEEETRKSNGN